jgi:hypothetical protein
MLEVAVLEVLEQVQAFRFLPVQPTQLLLALEAMVVLPPQDQMVVIRYLAPSHLPGAVVVGEVEMV